jgi:hypothetical protein
MSQLFKNNATTRLVSAIGAADLTFTVASAEGALFPTPAAGEHFFVTLENSVGTKEIVRVTSRAADTFTVDGSPGQGRGQETAFGGAAASSFSAGDLVELRLTAGFIEHLSEGSIVYVIDGGGIAITTGLKGFIEAPFNGAITSARLFADVSGSIEIDIWKDTYANYDPTVSQVGDSIVSLTPPALASTFKSQDIALVGWTTQFTKGDIFYFNVNSASTVTRVTLSLGVNRY